MSFLRSIAGVTLGVWMCASVHADSVPESMLNQCLEFTRQVIGIKSGQGESCFIGKNSQSPSESCSLRVSRDFNKQVGVVVPDWSPIFMGNEDIYINRKEGGYTTSYGLRCQMDHGYFFSATRALFNVVYEKDGPRQVYGGQSEYKNLKLEISLRRGVPTSFVYVAGYADYTNQYIDRQPGYRSCVELKAVSCDEARRNAVRRFTNSY